MGTLLTYSYSSIDPVFSMDGHSLSSVSDSLAGSNDEAPRVKFLCSFSGSIIPRPLDGRLRYVGGETRIVSVSRDIGFEELMSKMRELFEGVSVLKYQQPDEDLDALVSVVNDEDVVNMMEEYDKLGSGDGFTRLRIFLFSQPEQDLSPHYDGDERESERRYVDALNNLTDVLDFRKPESPVDDFNSLNLNYEFPMPHYNLQHLSIPGQHQMMMNPRYAEAEAPWSPAYYSPRNLIPDFPSSPSSARFHVPFGEIPDEYLRQQANQPFEHQPQVSDGASWHGERSAFPGNNLFHGPSAVEGNTICEHCRMAFQRNFENLSINNGFHQAVNPCSNCPPNREALTHHHGMYHDEQSNDNRSLYNGSVRANDYYAHNSVVDPRIVPSNYLPDQPMVGLSHIRVPPPEESGVRYGNIPVPVPFVGENHYSAQGHIPNHSLRRNIPSQTHVPSYEAPQVNNGKVNPGLPRSQWIENQNQWTESSKTSAFEGKPVPEYAHANASRVNSTTPLHESQQLVSPDLLLERAKEAARLEGSNVQAVSSSEVKDVNYKGGEISALESITSSKAVGENADVVITQGQKGHSALDDLNSPGKLHVLHELIASAKKTALDVASAMKAQVEENTDGAKKGSTELANADSDSDGDNAKRSGVESTKAEAEAIDMGLQVIKSDDIEEIRELGHGTYGSVYHGKWRGSDVAIKRIKSSCFHGRPHERKRLIADFWKEALILGSLHHPNVVSFYGIVHGSDGSLATVTEFMINGSLKQFLQKKDRTIDRRKRLIIAMDAAFGMEYLHEKNIVHFDLKCENLLVNMRDPQRPICKIGDLGLSKVKQHTLVSGGVRGTLPWMAPELLTGKTDMVTEKIDVYSFGIVMWELLTGEEPYADLHCSSVIGGIVNNTLRPEVPTWCDPEWKALMVSCWASDPAQRPSFSDISQKLRSMAAPMNVK